VSRALGVFFPASVAEASTLLLEFGSAGAAYGGGVKLVPLIRDRLSEVTALVDVKALSPLRGVTATAGTGTAGTGVRIGAAVRHAELAASALVRSSLPMLAEAEACLGNPRVRNQGTLGGNLCFADPVSDPVAPLLVYDAEVTLAGTGGERTLPLPEFLTGPFQTARRPGEILTCIHALELGPGWVQSYQRVERFGRPVATAAVAYRRADGTLTAIRLAVGCAGQRPQRLGELELRLTGLAAGQAQPVLAGTRDYLADVLRPRDDLFGSAAYKAHLASVLLTRGLDDPAAPDPAADGRL
jgi:aerobic carbon-monoxide dehydrogenase medium subunit